MKTINELLDDLLYWFAEQAEAADDDELLNHAIEQTNAAHAAILDLFEKTKSEGHSK